MLHIPGHGTHVGKLVRQSQHLRCCVRPIFQKIDGLLLAHKPGTLRRKLLPFVFGLLAYIKCNAFTKIQLQLQKRHFRVLQHIMQHCRGDEFLVIGHLCHDRCRLDGVNQIGDLIPLSCYTAVSHRRKNSRTLKQRHPFHRQHTL